MSQPTPPAPKVPWLKRQLAKVKTKLKQRLKPHAPSRDADINEFLNPPFRPASSAPVSNSNAIPRKPVGQGRQEISSIVEEHKSAEERDGKTKIEESTAQDLPKQNNERANIEVSEPEPKPTTTESQSDKKAREGEEGMLDAGLKAGSPEGKGKGLREGKDGKISALDLNPQATDPTPAPAAKDPETKTPAEKLQIPPPPPPVKTFPPIYGALATNILQTQSSRARHDGLTGSYGYGYAAIAYADQGGSSHSSHGNLYGGDSGGGDGGGGGGGCD